MIVLDTHIWLWALTEPDRLSQPQYDAVFGPSRAAGIGLSVISCWEVAMAVARGRIVLPVPLDDWMRDATRVEHLHLFALSPEIAIDSTRLPDPFHRDPADRIIVATARLNRCSLLTLDAKILAYPHVQTIG